MENISLAAAQPDACLPDAEAREKDGAADDAGTSAADSMDHIHRLLRLADRTYPGENGLISITSVGNFIKYSKPDFDPYTYGYEKLAQLIQAYPDRYEAARNNRGILSYKCITPEEENEAEEPQEITCVETEE